MALATNGPTANCFEANRSIVATATTDPWDQPATEDISDESPAISIASTVHIDNTSCYLKRYADKYACQKYQDKTRARTMFVRINKYKLGQVVVYTGHGGRDRATISDVYYEEYNLPMYNIELHDGYIEAHVSEDQLERLGKTFDKSEFLGPPIQAAADNYWTWSAPTSHKVVDFEASTPLFSFIYCRDFEGAIGRLESHPEEASVWVIRYGNADGSSYRTIRWKLLPLHFFIMLVGCRDSKIASGEPTITLLTALLSAYCHATKCIDDQKLIPLHTSIRGQSSLYIIKALVEADPDTVHWKDTKGRDAFALLDQVFKRQVKHAEVNAKTKDECHEVLKIQEWKQDVFMLLIDATKEASVPYEESNEEYLELPPKICRLKLENYEEKNDANAKHQGTIPSPSNVVNFLTPCSTMTTATETTTQTSSTDKDKQQTANEVEMSWESRCRVLELESYDSEDKYNLGTGAASIFRNRDKNTFEEAVRKINLVVDSECESEGKVKGATDTLVDSSLVLEAMLSYESEGGGNQNTSSEVFAPDAMLTTCENDRQGLGGCKVQDENKHDVNGLSEQDSPAKYIQYDESAQSILNDLE